MHLLVKININLPKGKPKKQTYETFSNNMHNSYLYRLSISHFKA